MKRYEFTFNEHHTIRPVINVISSSLEEASEEAMSQFLHDCTDQQRAAKRGPEDSLESINIYPVNAVILHGEKVFELDAVTK